MLLASGSGECGVAGRSLHGHAAPGGVAPAHRHVQPRGGAAGAGAGAAVRRREKGRGKQFRRAGGRCDRVPLRGSEAVHRGDGQPVREGTHGRNSRVECHNDRIGGARHSARNRLVGHMYIGCVTNCLYLRNPPYLTDLVHQRRWLRPFLPYGIWRYPHPCPGDRRSHQRGVIRGVSDGGGRGVWAGRDGFRDGGYRACLHRNGSAG
mmetsp:Transcript_9877/g.24172  ORF Transcript_9877/g.24172 Transcript_9877/m.24172 type:complete len:207 (-) Transcript_9877:2065-2685(-)